MNKMEKLELEILKFMRGKYRLNEVAEKYAILPYVPYQYEEQ